jgi:3-hydroxyisobutyrate dehydrogenase-like beta-hydroxyacid dehydrogenase
MARIGIIGLGTLGSAMARRLLGARHEVVGYNRTAAKAAALEADGLTVAARPEDACDTDLVLSVLLNDAAVEDVLLAGAPFRSSAATHVSVSTIGVPLVGKLAAHHAANGQRFVSAPVFGRPEAALAGTMVVACAGSDDAVNASRAILEAFGRVEVIGTDPAAANVAKMAGNFLMASAVQSLREALALVEAGGGDRKQFADIVAAALFPTSFYERFGSMLATQGGDAPAVNPFANSARLSGQTAADLGVAAPLARTLAAALATPLS